MGVSFKVSKAGTRYKPKLLPTEDKDHENGSVSDSQQRDNEGNSAGMGALVADPSSVRVKSGRHSVLDDLEVSFLLNLFQNGFSVGKATEVFDDVPKQLHPYDRASETLFSAIECGWLPGDIFDDLPCKYVNGAILCEIKDYRGCLIQGRGTGSTEKFPNVHKVLLHMRMENVAKDILSISDDSWTYRDLLEVESHILKALQPDLHLNPQPLQDRYSGEPLTKKVNLGIMWSWKKRKLCNTSNTGLDLSNSYYVTDVPPNCATQNCSSLLDLSYQEGGVTFSEQNVSTSSVNPQGNNILLENSQSNPLTPQPKYKVGDSCNQSALTVMTTSNVVSVSKRSLADSNNYLSKPSSSVFGERGRCETQEVQGPLLKKPKQEPLDISFQQLTGSQTENSLKPYLQWNNKLMHQRTEDEKVLHERFQDKVHPSLVINNCQKKRFQGISEMQAGVATSVVKLVPAQASFANSNARMINDNPCVMDRRIIQSKLLQSQKQQSSPLLRDNIPTDTSLNCLVQPVDKNIRNRSVTQMRKDLEKCQVKTGERHASANSQNINFLPREVSVPAKRKKNPHPKCSSIKIVDSSTRMSNVNAGRATHILTNLTSPQPSEVKVDSFLDRLLKIQAVTKRYGLHNKKCKLDKFLKKKPFFPISPLVAFQLFASNDHNGKLENTSTDKIPLSECSMDWGIGICKTRTLTFLRQSHIHRGNEIPMVDREAQVRLVISLKLNEGRVDASVLYGIEEDVFSIDYPLLPGFPSTHSANLLATQFTSLMVHEGYYLASDQVEPTPLNVNGGLSSQWRSVHVSGIATSSAQTIGIPSTSTLTQRLSPFRLRPMSSIMSSHNSMQLLSHNIFSGGQSLPTENTQSKQPLDTAAQVNCMRPELQQIQNKRANLLYQSLQRQKQQNELAQRISMVGGLGATAGGLGMIQQGGGIQGLGNVGLGSFGNGIGMRSSTPPMALGGQTWMGNVGQFNNLGRKISGLNDSKLLGLISDPSAAFLSKLRAAEGQGKALMSGVPVQRNAGEVPMQYISNIPDMTCKLSNQKQLQIQMHQQEMRSPPQQSQQNIVQQLPEMMPFPQHPQAASLAKHVGSPQSHVSSHQQFDQQLPVSQQLSLESVLHQVNVMVGYASPELSSHTHGSVGSNKM